MQLADPRHRSHWSLWTQIVCEVQWCEDLNDLIPLHTEARPTRMCINCRSFFLIYHAERHYWGGVGGVGGGHVDTALPRQPVTPSRCSMIKCTGHCINSPFGPWPALLDVTSDKSAIETSFSWQQQIPNKCRPIEPTFLVNSAVISVPEPGTCLWASVAVALSVRRCYVHRWSQRQVSHPQTSVTALIYICIYILKKTSAATKSIHSI